MYLLFWLPAVIVAGTIHWVMVSLDVFSESTRKRVLLAVWALAVLTPFWDVVPGKIALAIACEHDMGVKVLSDSAYTGTWDRRLARSLERTNLPWHIERLQETFSDKQTGTVVATAVWYRRYPGDQAFLAPWAGASCPSYPNDGRSTDFDILKRELDTRLQKGR